jgi:CRP/FNR family transcriptional regulator, cyclic AMP receptor protein
MSEHVRCHSVQAADRLVETHLSATSSAFHTNCDGSSERWHWVRRSTSIKRYWFAKSPLMASILDLCRSLPARAFESGTDLLCEGKTAGVLYVLIEGEVEILKDNFQVAVISDPGAIFGEISVLLDIPNTATVRAISPCTAHVVEDCDLFLQSHKEIAYQLSKLLAQRVYRLTTYLVDLKRQFEQQGNHLSMVDEVLETLIHDQRQSITLGSDRDPGV